MIMAYSQAWVSIKSLSLAELLKREIKFALFHLHIVKGKDEDFKRRDWFPQKL